MNFHDAVTCWSSRLTADIQVFGELEYVFGCLKLMFITLLIVLMLILSTMNRKFNLVVMLTLM